MIAVILAAGLGTRMRSPLAKVLHPLLGRPMVGWVVEAAREAGAAPLLVVGHQEESVRAAFRSQPDVRFARQDRPLGTGDALRAALPMLPASGPVLVLAGDTPLITAADLRRLIEGASSSGAQVALASFEVDDPRGYGRIVREGAPDRAPKQRGAVRIVEQKDCTPEQDRIREVNSGAYLFDAALLHAGLPGLAPNPRTGEFYLTDLVPPEAAVIGGFAPEAFMGVNDRAALAEARALLRRRINRQWALAGVDLPDLDSPLIEPTARLEPDAQIGVGAVLRGACRVAGTVGDHCVLEDTEVEAGAVIRAGTVATGAVIRAGAVAGPMSHLRPGAVLEAGAHVGNYVEIKNSRVHAGAKANHLTYLGDADVGPGANVGAGTITCNYDGFSKHRTEIGAGAFIGSNTALVAPIRIGAGAIIGAGSTVTEEVPEGAVAVARPPLRISAGGAGRLRARLIAAKEAAGGRAQAGGQGG